MCIKVNQFTSNKVKTDLYNQSYQKITKNIKL